MFYKDLGYEYIQQGLDKNAMGAKITYSFYDVPIWHIDIIEDNYFTTMLNKRIDNETYALSFDYSSEILLQILQSLPMTQQQQILSDIEEAKRGTRKVEFENPIIIKSIQAQVGTIYQNANEIYAPFIVKNIDMSNS